MTHSRTKIIYIFLITILISSCSQNHAPFRAEVTFITGTLKINNIDASIGNAVIKDDILKTGVKSEATIQVTDTAVISLKADTELRFENILLNNDDTRTISMELNHGKTFHNVLKKGTEYSVKAPTSVASVRGTTFEVSENNSKTFIAVEAGTVSVKRLSGKLKNNSRFTEGQRNGSEEIILTAGQSLELYSAKQKSDKKTVVRNLRAVKRTSATINNKNDNKKKYTTEKREEEEKEEDDDEEETKEIEAITSRNIDRITLYSGEIITGTILERGETYSINTSDGIKKISRKDIRNNEIFK